MSEHNKSEMHLSITKFLFPTCNVCSTQFFSPIAYEKHIATLMHIKVNKNGNLFRLSRNKSFIANARM